MLEIVTADNSVKVLNDAGFLAEREPIVFYLLIQMIAENIKQIQSRIDKAKLSRSGLSGDVTLIAVTKTVEDKYVSDALDFGIKDIAESRIQEACPKFERLASKLFGVKKHLIGHLQTNKAKKAVEVFDLIHSVDSLRLAEEINKHALSLGKVQDCLVEVKVSEEESKFGVDPRILDELLSGAESLKNIKVHGLMAMVPFFEDPELTRPYFRRVKEIFDKVRCRGINSDFNILSMGMSGDFEVAVQEGSTMVRVGTAIFGERKYEN